MDKIQLSEYKAFVNEIKEKIHRVQLKAMQGFSARNLWLMRSFYLEYKANKKLQPLVAEIGWSHNIIIMEKCKVPLEREFYIKMTKKYGWTRDILIYQIEAGTYKRYLVNQTNFEKTLAIATKENNNPAC